MLSLSGQALLSSLLPQKPDLETFLEEEHFGLQQDLSCKQFHALAAFSRILSSVQTWSLWGKMLTDSCLDGIYSRKGWVEEMTKEVSGSSYL